MYEKNHFLWVRNFTLLPSWRKLCHQLCIDLRVAWVNVHRLYCEMVPHAIEKFPIPDLRICWFWLDRVIRFLYIGLLSGDWFVLGLCQRQFSWWKGLVHFRLETKICDPWENGKRYEFANCRHDFMLKMIKIGGTFNWI